MSNDMKAAEFAAADSQTLALIVHESDKRIAALVQVLLATDSRSNTLLSATSALAAAAFGVAASQYPTQGLSPLVLGSAVFATCAASAAIAAVRALWPTEVDIQGWGPARFRSDLAAAKPYDLLLAEIAVHNQAKIDQNVQCNAMIADRVRLTMILLASAPLSGALVALVRALWRS